MSTGERLRRHLNCPLLSSSSNQNRNETTNISLNIQFQISSILVQRASGSFMRKDRRSGFNKRSIRESLSSFETKNAWKYVFTLAYALMCLHRDSLYCIRVAVPRQGGQFTCFNL